jgi:hypothetical protein
MENGNLRAVFTRETTKERPLWQSLQRLSFSDKNFGALPTLQQVMKSLQTQT